MPLHVPTISVVNESTVVDDNDIDLYVAAQHLQVVRDFEPRWGRSCHIARQPINGADWGS